MKIILSSLLFLFSLIGITTAQRETPPDSFTESDKQQQSYIDTAITNGRDTHGEKWGNAVYAVLYSLYEQYSDDETLSYLFRHIFASVSVLSGAPDEPIVETYLVGSTPLACSGAAYEGCLLIKPTLDDDWNFFIDPIAGFSYKSGQYYVVSLLRVYRPAAISSTHSLRYDYFLIDSLPFISDELDQIYQ